MTARTSPRHPLRAAIAGLLVLALGGCAEPEAFGPGQPDAVEFPPVAFATAATDVWESKAEMPTARMGLVAGTVNGVLYAVGGSNNLPLTTVEAYTPGSNTWATRAPLPQARTNLNGAGVINGVLYVAGGYFGGTPTNTLFAYTPSSNTWTTRAPMPAAGGCGASGVIAGKLYVYTTDCAGPGVFQRYDPATNQWVLLRAPQGHLHGAAGVVDGKFYLAGGFNGFTRSRVLDSYDPVSGFWTTRAPMPGERVFAAGAGLNGLFYVVSGAGSCPILCQGQYVYDPKGDRWREKPAEGTFGRTSHAVAVTGTKLYAVGGQYYTGGVSASTYAYTPGDVWVTKSPLPTARHSLVAAAVGDKLYALGGAAPGTVTKLATNQAYTPSTDRWISRAPLPEPRSSPNGATVLNGVIYVPGGYHAGYTNTLFAYAVSSNTWAIKAPMPAAGGEGASCVIGGKLYVTSHVDAGFNKVRRLDRYDPSTNTWVTRAGPSAYHGSPAAGVINGKLYLAGGNSTSNLSAGVSGVLEAYTPSTNTWTTLAPMPTARAGAASLVSNGLLYVIGGSGAGGTQLATVEVYNPATNSWRTLTPMFTARTGLAGGVIKGVLYAVGGLSLGATGTIHEAYTP